jgi:hypothetical protein
LPVVGAQAAVTRVMKHRICGAVCGRSLETGRQWLRFAARPAIGWRKHPSNPSLTVVLECFTQPILVGRLELFLPTMLVLSGFYGTEGRATLRTRP